MSQNAIHSVAFKTNVANAKQIKERDSIRVKHVQAGHQPHGPAARYHKHHEPCGPSGSATCIPVTNAGVTYLADVCMGDNSKACSLLIDTGSSNTWVKKECYKPTSASTDTREKFSIQYGQGATSGTIYEDTVTMGSLVIKNQLIGVADNATDMNNMDGILGIGPCCLTEGTTSDNTPIPTVTDNCLNQRLIANACIGIYYEPTAADNDSNGKTGCLSFGGPDISKCTSEINYVPITKTDPACKYWGIDQSICYNGKEIMAKCAGIADTGTTMCMLPESTFQTYKEEVGAELDPNTGLLTVTQKQFECMQDMCFKIGGKEYKLTPDAQTWPRSQNENLGVPKDAICLIFASMGDMENQGLDFINGYTFLQRFYSVYDTGNMQVGFATTKHTTSTSNQV
ncbi:acid protease [Mycena olivaceomarginata]|nr:acid protease [Mycena olivaceomarginata]